MNGSNLLTLLRRARVQRHGGSNERLEGAGVDATALRDIDLDLSSEENLASNPTNLVDYLNRVFMNSAMSDQMRAVLIDTIGKLPVDDPEERVLSVLWLILNSPEYVVEK